MMNKIIDFIKDNALSAIFVLVAVILVITTIIILLKRPKKEKIITNIKIEEGLTRLEKLHYKKCKKCGGNVPRDDHLCQNCGQIPD